MRTSTSRSREAAERAARGAVIAALCLAALPGARSASEPAQETPRDWSIIERTRVSLLLLDVEVVDRDGRPIHGLTRADFMVQIDLREHPIYSVDDLCPAEAPATVAAGTSEPGPASESGTPAARPATPASPAASSPSALRYILYFDYSHLDGGGRSRATAEALRWVRETLRSGEEAMVAAYAEQAGLREIVPFTGERERLIEGILALSSDPAFLDAFALGFPMRISRCCETCPQPDRDCCETCCPRADCFFDAQQQYLQGKHSLTALRAFLQGLEEWPGRKALILFQQQLSLTPSQLYGYRAPGDVIDRFGDQHRLLDEVAAEANLTSTAITAAFMGDHLDSYAFVPRLGVAFGHDLADFTGGRFNRGGFDLATAMDETGRAACIYRIGLRLPERLGGKVLRAKVWVRDRPVASRFRVKVLTETDRWWRKAQNLLARPDLARDVPLAVDVFPTRRGEKGWRAEARIALDTEHLTWLPAGGKDEGQLELGALLSRGRWKREMLARSTLRTARGEAAETLLLTRSFSDLAPGDYRLGAFVRDRMGGLFGASAAEIHLPERGIDDLAGPLAIVAGRTFLRAALPLLEQKEVPGHRAVRLEGTLPVTAEAVARGTPIEFHSWICPEKGPARPDDLVRFVAGETGPQFRFDDAVLAAAGDCALLVDALSTEGLVPGTYEYIVWWSPGTGKERIERELEFGVVDTSSPSTGVERDVGADGI